MSNDASLNATEQRVCDRLTHHVDRVFDFESWRDMIDYLNELDPIEASLVVLNVVDRAEDRADQLDSLRHSLVMRMLERESME